MRVALASPLLVWALLACRAAPAPQQAQSRQTMPRGTIIEQGAAARDPAALLRARIAAAYGLPDARIEAQDADAATVQAMVRTRVKPAMATGAVAYGGRDYRFTPADGMGRQASLWRVRYRDAAAATAAARAVAGQSYMASMILTPMTVARRGDEVLILSTESGGDAKLVALIGAVAKEMSATLP